MTTWQLASLRLRVRGQSRCHSVFYDLVSEVACHSFCHVLLVRPTLKEYGRGLHRSWIPGGTDHCEPSRRPVSSRNPNRAETDVPEAEGAEFLGQSTQYLGATQRRVKELCTEVPPWASISSYQGLMTTDGLMSPSCFESPLLSSWQRAYFPQPRPTCGGHQQVIRAWGDREKGHDSGSPGSQCVLPNKKLLHTPKL